MTSSWRAFCVFALLLLAGAAYSQEVELDLPGCESNAFPPLSKLLLLNAVCEAAAPDTKRFRVSELKKAKKQYPGCYRAFELSRKHAELFNRLTAETAAASPGEVTKIRDNCRVYFNGS